MDRPLIVILEWLADGELAKLQAEFSGCEIVEARTADLREIHLPRAQVTYGLPALDRLASAQELRWIQLISAGVPQALCAVARARGLTVTNLAGLYGPTIAEHALGLMLMLSRNIHLSHRNQDKGLWDRTVSRTMQDLHGKTLAVVGLGNIGTNIARLARSFGMRVVGCRRTLQPTPFVDQVFARGDLAAMLGEAEYVAVAAPWTPETDGMLGPNEFRAMKQGAFYINVSRGPVAHEAALLEALQSGHLAGAGLDVFAVEPLAADHPLWSMPNVVVTPHYSGETVNQSAQPAQRLARNLRAWLAGKSLEGVVKLELGY